MNNVRHLDKYYTKKKNNQKIKVCCVFTLTGKEGKKTEYLGLFDTGSRKSLISAELVKRYAVKTKKDKGKWNTNTGQFKTTQIATAKNITLPQWSNKRTILQTELAVNPNSKQKYKAIFGLNFMLDNKFDILFSKETIEWEGIGILMYHQREPRSENECNKLEQSTMQGNKYKFMKAKDITYLNNQKHLDKEKKKNLKKYYKNLMTYSKGELEVTLILKSPLI